MFNNGSWILSQVFTGMSKLTDYDDINILLTFVIDKLSTSILMSLANSQVKLKYTSLCDRFKISTGIIQGCIFFRMIFDGLGEN